MIVAGCDVGAPLSAKDCATGVLKVGVGGPLKNLAGAVEMQTGPGGSFRVRLFTIFSIAEFIEPDTPASETSP